MSDVAAVNASPLIVLVRAQLLDLLQLAGTRVVVPDPVAAEILRRGAQDPAARALSAVGWLERTAAVDVPASVRAWNLGPGESSVIAWALGQRQCRIVIDDLLGRRCAEAHGLRIRGSLGLVLRAKRKGMVPAASPLVERLRSAGLFLSDRVVRLALAEVGE